MYAHAIDDILLQNAFTGTKLADFDDGDEDERSIDNYDRVDHELNEERLEPRDYGGWPTSLPAVLRL